VGREGQIRNACVETIDVLIDTPGALSRDSDSFDGFADLGRHASSNGIEPSTHGSCSEHELLLLRKSRGQKQGGREHDQNDTYVTFFHIGSPFYGNFGSLAENWLSVLALLRTC
jgi:hypothetical protein